MTQIRIDSEAVLAQLAELGEERQGPFILARGLNLLAKKVQANLRQNITETLKVRRKAWMNRQTKIDRGTWATKTRLKVRIYMDDPASFVADFETGADHTPILGRKFLAIPNPKVFGRSIIGKDHPLRVKNLNLRATPWGLRGDQRTLVIQANSGTPLVVQRVGQDVRGAGRRGVKRTSGLRLLYTLVKLSRRPRRIAWYQTAEATVAGEQVGIFAEVISAALRDTR